MPVAKLIRAQLGGGGSLLPRQLHRPRFCCRATSKPPNNSSLLMASVYDIKLFVRDNGSVATRTDNYFELRNRGMGFYMELRRRNHSRVHEPSIARGAMAGVSPIIFAPADSLRRPLMGKQNRTLDYNRESVNACTTSQRILFSRSPDGKNTAN